jgi:glycosyltransferase involved in cell wall biosynthesis
MKILHLPVMNAGQPPVIAAAQRRLGHEADTLSLQPHAFGYPADRQLNLNRDDVASAFKVLCEVIEQGYEVFHFYCRSLLNTGPNLMPAGWDLPLLRALGKKIIFNFRGSEVRLPSVSREVNPHHYFDRFDKPVDELYLRDYLMMVSAYADHVIVPDEELRLYVPWATVIPRAIETARYEMVGPVRRERPLVLHAPSNRLIKGTPLILDAVRRLHDRGVAFDFQLIENVGHDQCVEAIKGADIVIDQIHLGTHGVLSMEAMAMGKTVLCYMIPQLAPADCQEWMVNVNPNTLAIKLEEVIGDFDLRRRLGAAARQHVQRVHDADTVAAELIDLYRRPPARHDPACHRNWPVRFSKAWVSASQYQLAECRAMLHRNAELLEQAMWGLAPAKPPAPAEPPAPVELPAPAEPPAPAKSPGPGRLDRLLRRLLRDRKTAR